MYNQQAESYAVGKTPSIREGVPEHWTRFLDVYSDIADVTSTDRPFKAKDLIGKLNCVAHLAPRTQSQILAVVLRDMQTLPEESDGLAKVVPGTYRWRFSKT